jgi:peptidoglycan/LPS O-acetylase OafA/YrhL
VSNTANTVSAEDAETARKPPIAIDFHKRLPALDGLRGIAILLVFFYHYAGGLPDRVPSGPLHLVGMFFAFGWSGVDLFFVLSGFLITGILFDTQNDPHYYRNFYARRVLRIFPPFYLLALVYLLLTPVLGAHWRWLHLSYLLYLGFPFALIWPTLMQISPLVLTNHLWSLCAEEQFYLIWPWTVAQFRNSAAILRACVVAGVVAFLFRLCICLSQWLSIGWTHDFLVSRMDTLALGAAIAIMVRGPRQKYVLRWAPAAFVVAAGGVVGMCVVRHTVNHFDPVIATIGFSVIALAYGALLLLALRPGSWVEWFLSLSVLRIFGKYSYGMYLYDLPLTVLLSPRREFFIARLHSYAIGSVVFMIFCLLLNLVIAGASFHLIESPIMRLKSRFKYIE